MSTNGTSFAKGNQAALKHGGYSASVTWQRQVQREADRRYKQGRLTPLENDIRKNLIRLRRMIKSTEAQITLDGGLFIKGKLTHAAGYLDKLLTHQSNQASLLWRMLAQTTKEPPATDEGYFDRYGGEAKAEEAGP